MECLSVVGRRRRHHRRSHPLYFTHRDDTTARVPIIIVSCFPRALANKRENERERERTKRDKQASKQARPFKEQSQEKKLCFIRQLSPPLFFLSRFLSQGTPPTSKLQETEDSVALFYFSTMSFSALRRSPFSNLKPASSARCGRTRWPSRTTLAPSPRSACFFVWFGKVGESCPKRASGDAAPRLEVGT